MLAVACDLFENPTIVRLADDRGLECAETGDLEGTPILAIHGGLSTRLGAAVYDEIGRFEREFEASFTKAELQAICEALEVESDGTARPSTPRMRRRIRAEVGVAESVEAADGATFRKADLQEIADVLGASPEPETAVVRPGSLL